MENNEAQRIYVGGLDPSRASRLRAVKDVEITSINDVAIKDRGDDATCPSSEPIYNPKHRVIDEDGDLVDTRKFFYIEARSTGASSSALDLLAKQYHNTKWKGCSLRVEEAKPHFLKRLEQEREEREAKAAAVAAAVFAEIKEAEAEAQAKEEDGSVDEKGANKEIKNKRRLRIRQRFGAEAFLVDTLPRKLQLGNGSAEGWNDFAFLRKRMINKRESQRKNLIERRKQERRSWAGGKGNLTVPQESNDLRSLIFLNRGIHIRFDSVEATDLVSDDNSDVSKEDVTASDESSSTSHQSADDQQKAYMWSDDEDEDDSIDNAHDDKNTSTESGEEVRIEGADTDDESIDKRLSKPTRTNNLRAGAEYTKAVVADEFAFGADDFDFDPSNDDTESVHADNLAFDESMDIGLEDDISSNINILSKLFPGDHFDSKPLANANDGGTSNGSGDAKEKQKFAAGQIMQRYDPTKDTDKRFEKVETKLSNQRKKSRRTNQTKSKVKNHLPQKMHLAEEEEEKTTTKTTETPPTNAVMEESKEDVYEQDELENVFKQSRQETITSAAGGFSFGFQVPTEATSEKNNQSTSTFSFGFNVSDEPKVDEEPTTDVPPVTSEEAAVAVEKRKQQRQSSLNEGPHILKDLDAMKQDEENQNLWQKEREQLTSDWKRKQKSAQSRRVKQKRR
ncbi:hypothetical protein QTG54_001216 [Skeletonema marinoi]|uniref:RRM domain-containing protein n=1 Tax=Skeletonema marinoi TaxID=267567 RepID=A0AAD9DJ90_9STRA|nr:hypothetical protein QTG54_001216 [Skeletonema marinoi]